MRQRNESGYPKHVMAWPKEEDPGREPFVLGHGESIDYPELLAGCVLEEDPPPVPKTKKTASAVPAQIEGAETA